MYRGGASLAGAYGDDIAAPLALDWRFTSTYFGHNPSAPAVADGTVYFASGSRIYAVDENSGARKWIYPADAPLPTTIHSSPAVADGMLYVGGDDGKLIALDAKTGKDVWKFDTRSGIGTPPTIAEGVVYFGSVDGKIWAIDAKSGVAVTTWKNGFKMLDETAGAPAVANGMVYTLSTDQMLHAIGAATGKERWFYRLGGSVLNQCPVVSGDYLYVANGSNLTSLLSRNGMLRWNKMMGVDLVVSPAVNDQGIYVVTADNKVLAFDPHFGKPKWKAGTEPKLEYDVIAPPTIAGKTLLVGTTMGGIYAIDTDTGAVKWTYSTSPSSTSDTLIAANTNVAAPIVVADKNVFVLSDDGSLSAFRADAPDTLGPRVSDTEPEMGIVINGAPPLSFQAKIVDEGSGINPDSVKLMLDGVGVARKPSGPRGEDKPGWKFDPVTSTVEYTIEEASSAATIRNLADGRHTVTVAATDWKGNTTTKTWSFTVDNSVVKIVKRKTNDTTNQGGGGPFGRGRGAAGGNGRGSGGGGAPSPGGAGGSSGGGRGRGGRGGGGLGGG